MSERTEPDDAGLATLVLKHGLDGGPRLRRSRLKISACARAERLPDTEPSATAKKLEDSGENLVINAEKVIMPYYYSMVQ